jgi:hypothetical protein
LSDRSPAQLSGVHGNWQGEWALTRGIVAIPVVAAVLLAAATGVGEAQRAGSAQRVEIEAQTIDAFDARDPSRRQFGTLVFRGGLVLKSSHRQFGGLSALRMSPDGARLLALTDRGYWLHARMLYRDGAPVGLADAEMAPVTGPDGRPLNRRGWYDTEALAEDDGKLYVAVERVHEILRFDYRGHGLPGRGQPIAVPPAIKKLPSNKGIECLAVSPKGAPQAGTPMAISERGLDAAGNILGFLIGAGAGTFTVRRTEEFDVSDCTIAPRGDLLLLERRFSWARGVALRIRRLPLANLKAGAVLDGPQLVYADMGFQIDNMEGIAVHRERNGAHVLTLISDDNFSPLQRTLLLQFTLAGE